MSDVVVRFDRAHGKDAAGPGRQPLGRIVALSLDLGSGVHGFIGSVADGTLALAEICAGRRDTTSGRVHVLGKRPARSPAVRRRIGLLGGTPELPPGPTIGGVVSAVRRAHGSLDDPLERYDLAALRARRPASLSLAEQRAVELALALTLPNPALLVLHEPFANVALGANVRTRLRELAADGVCVIVTSSSLEDMRSLADAVHMLDRGRLVNSSGTREWLHATTAELVVWLGDTAGGPPALARHLSNRDDVSGVAWRWRDRSQLGQVSVHGAGLDSAARAIADACTELGVEVHAIEERAAARQVGEDPI